MKESFLRAKEDISSYLIDYFDSAKKSFGHVNSWATTSCELLQDFCFRGKMMRGSLVVLFATRLGVDRQQAVVAGAAMELLQSGVLVHDDIMDEDDVRRGGPAIHSLLSQQVDERFGLGGGICLGDVSLFMAFDVLNKLQNDALVSLFSSEAISLGFGQMQDVYFGEDSHEPSLEEIFSVYKYKTGRYTFSLPLLLAACLADREDLFSQLESFGMEIGISFQIRDDLLGLFGDSSRTGKPVGADIRENKKTVIRYELFRLANAEDKLFLESVFGTDVSSDDISKIHEIVSRCKARSATQLHAQSADMRAQEVLDNLQIPTDARKVLEWVVSFNQSRDK